MFKRITVLLLIIFSLVLLCACSAEPISSSNPAPSKPSSDISSKEENTENIYDQPFEMELVGRSTNNNFRYFRDTVTDVLYLYRKNGSSGGLTVMLDPTTGLPMTYTQYMKLAGEPIS